MAPQLENAAISTATSFPLHRKSQNHQSWRFKVPHRTRAHPPNYFSVSNSNDHYSLSHCHWKLY